MRRRCATASAVVMCLALGVLPALAQSPPPPPAAVWVTGTAIENGGSGGTVAQVGDVTQTRGEIFTDTMTMSDPRVSGAGSGTWNQDSYPGDIGISWGTFRLENAGGAWTGTFVSADGPTVVSSGFLIGEGGYEGLTFYWHQDTGDTVTVTGIIFPGDPPTP